jgi:UDP-N-acetylmuramyl pentapeptide phosphotransferase/UDP-N-acetylglucosamine-1-phosphate transferase
MLSAVVAALLAAPLLRTLAENGLVHENYRGATLPFPGGAAIVAAAVISLAPLALIDELADQDVLRPELTRIAVYALGMAFLGFLDDMLGGEPRGWRGHGAAVAGGGVSTGALKAVGALGLACFALSGLGYSTTEYLFGVGLLILTTNLFNLLDLRPGRTGKAFVALGVGLTLGSLDLDPLWALGLFAGPVLVLSLADLRERTMLGDTGSNLIGALAGFWLVLTLSTTGQQIAFAIVLAITIYGEFRSISTLIERAPLLRQLDSLGRPDYTHA